MTNLTVSDIHKYPELLSQLPDDAFSHALCVAVVAKFPYFLEHIQHQTKDICFTAVRADWKALRWVHKPTRDIEMEALWRSGLALQYIDKPNKQQCLRAVRTTPSAIQLIPNLSPELCLELLRANGDAIDFTANPTQEMLQEAAASKQRKLAPFFKPAPSSPPEMLSNDELIVELKNGKEVLRFLSSQTRGICCLAVSKNSNNLEWVQLPVDTIMDPMSGQLEDWIAVLQATSRASEYAVRKVGLPISKALPFKRKGRIDEWIAPAGPGGETVMDRMLLLSAEIARLAPNSHWATGFVSRVQKQLEFCLSYKRPMTANPITAEAEHGFVSLDDVL